MKLKVKVTTIGMTSNRTDNNIISKIMHVISYFNNVHKKGKHHNVCSNTSQYFVVMFELNTQNLLYQYTYNFA